VAEPPVSLRDLDEATLAAHAANPRRPVVDGPQRLEADSARNPSESPANVFCGDAHRWAGPRLAAKE